ncbi:MAG: DUF2927 domain-containing protein [Deltaproteobacteria bacterium]
MKRLLAVFLCLSACVPVPEDRVARLSTPTVRVNFPPMKSFSDGTAVPVTRSNQAMAQDFMDLMFALETGRALPVMSRFEGPITVGTNGRLPPTLNRDLDALLRRLRSEAGISIERTSGRGDITIEALPVSALSKNLSQAACFVAPNVSSWQEYAASRKRNDWTSLTERNQVAIFVPADAAPQELRDCLHEELAQSLGPVNDLYRLSDSIFNDDNFQSVLTSFDMLMLRVAYDGRLHSGMKPAEVVALLPEILPRLNPAGGSVSGALSSPVVRGEWDGAIGAALADNGAEGGRKGAASRALKLAGSDPMRQALAYFALGRAMIGVDNNAAREAMTTARNIWLQSPVTEIYAASATLPLAAHALANGQTDLAISLSDQAAGAAAKGQNAALYAQFLMVKAEALAMRGEADEAARLRGDAYAYAVYGFGSDQAIRQRADSIARLAVRGSN